MNERQYLNEMGIDCWEIRYPERFKGVQLERYTLDDSCRLLFVSPKEPKGEDTLLLEKIAQAMQLSLQQIQIIHPDNIDQLASINVTWLWLAGIDDALHSRIMKHSEGTNTQILTSPLLSEIKGNTQHRRHLWQQICSYDTEN